MARVSVPFMIRVYGLKNCDVCRRVIKEFSASRIDHVFRDFRLDGIDIVKLERWMTNLGHEVLINKRGTTWRELSQHKKEDMNNEKAMALIIENPALIKRPIFEVNSEILVGYKDEQKKVLGVLSRGEKCEQI